MNIIKSGISMCNDAILHTPALFAEIETTSPDFVCFY
jgi:hypothetical protein